MPTCSNLHMESSPEPTEDRHFRWQNQRFGLDECLSNCRPYLITDDRHHEEQINSQRPNQQKFWSLQMSPRDHVFLRFGELVVFKRGQYETLVSTGDRHWIVLILHHGLTSLLRARQIDSVQ